MIESVPVAIVGIGCRFPGGAHGPESYWQLLASCADAVRPVPPERWSSDFHDPDPRTPGTSYTHRAGYLDDPGRAFDASFFGISPREAETLDPQQRLLLEVAVEAMDDAGLPLERVRGSRTGVFVGGFTLDNLLLRFADLTAVDNHTATSSSMTVLSNRTSYTFDLRGPSMTVDTACSSSLVATHLACRALRDGDCDVALAGGVNVMLLPNFQVVMCKGRFLAPDGRSKAFDAAADGYGRGEGAGFVVLKRLERAIADGDRIYAVIRGTGVNQDGATDGMPQPSGPAQRALFREVCERAGVDPTTVDYIEAHGTGTALGDVTEVGALADVYGRPGDPDAPQVGSVKPNIGHLEAAAGIAGLIKAALAVHHGRIPEHFRPGRVNPALRLDESGLRLPEATAPWPRAARRAAVNSFGYGGTNAHAVLEEAPIVPLPPGSRAEALPITAHDPEALSARAAQMADLLEEGAALADVAGTLAHHRSQLATRAVVLAADAVPALRALAAGQAHPALVGPAPRAGGVAWLYTGMGPQWAGMGAQLYTANAAFRAGLDAACAELAVFGLQLHPELFLAAEASRMERNDVAQPANFALQVGLTYALRAANLAPDVIIGHSTGEMAAAWAAGALTLAQAAQVVALRSSLQQEVAGGGMLAVATSADELRPRLARIGGLEIAAYNAPESLTVAGGRDALDALAAELERDGIWSGAVRVQVAYHSAHMDPIGARLVEGLADLVPSPPTACLISTVTGARVTEAVHTGPYWWRNTRGAVHLEDAVRAALGLGADTFLEVGPHVVLGPAVRAVGGSSVTTLNALNRKAPEPETLLRAISALYVRGASVAPDVFADRARIDLPAYPWQRKVLWREPAAVLAQRTSRPGAHPLLRTPEGDGWSTRLDGTPCAWLRDHVVRDAPILPGAAFVEAARAAAAEATGDGHVVLSEVTVRRALSLEPPGVAQWLHTEVRDGRVSVRARAGEGPFTEHASARIEEARRWRLPAPLDLAALRASIGEPVDVSALYAAFARRGLAYGPAFRGIAQLWRAADQVLAVVDAEVAPSARFALPPSALDAAFQALLAGVRDDRTLLPVGIERVQSIRPVPPTVWVHGAIRSDDGERLIGDLTLADAAGDVVARVIGLTCQAMAAPAVSADRWWHGTRWTAVAPGAARDARFTVVGDRVLEDVLRGGRGPERVVWVAPDALDPVGEDLVRALIAEVARAVARGVGLDVVTRGATHGDPAHAAVWGLARVARVEHPTLGLRLFDVDPSAHELFALVAALRSGDDEEEVLIRDGDRLVARIERQPPADATPVTRTVPAGSLSVRVEVAAPGSLDSLVYVPCARPSPGPGQVEIEVEAAPLNFKDVMKAMGLLDATALEGTYLGWDLGLEAVGRVVSTGPGATLAVGQRVLVYTGGTLRSHVVADEAFVVPCPEAWSAAQASSFFVTATAWHALIDAARLQAGETALIHSAAGGVGLAAVRIARAAGARVIATAGTEAKRAFLRDQEGVEHVLDSRTLDFGDDVRALTGGRGVDVVLNSLGGRAIDVGLGCLAPGGRFVEIGKRDLALGRPIGLGAFNRRTAFLAVDLDRAASEDPGYFPVLARQVLAALVDGRIAPLPAEVVPADRLVDAFRALASGAQVGKIAVSLRDGTMALADGLGRAFSPSAGRSWLVTGGLGGFGLATAAWLADRGVTHLVLASRRGAPSGADAATVQRLRDRGVEVRLAALDVADADAVTDLVASIDPPLAGVVHAAALLEDAPLADVTADAVRRVLDAKARGAWNLHRATAGLRLEAFVMYDSIAAQVGNPGQGAYAAANVALEGLAALRRSRGLAATAVAWGALDEVGMVARDAATAAHLRSVGLTPMPPGAALDALGPPLAVVGAVVSLVDIDWTRWARAHAQVPWKRLDEVVEAEESGPVGLAGELAALPEAERLPHAVERLASAAAPIFKLAASEIAPHRPLRDLGLDSLMAVELAVALGRTAGIEVSAMDLLGGRSLLGLAQRLVGASAPAPAVTWTAERLRERVLLTAPYDRLEAVRVDGATLRAEVAPDRLPGDLGPIAAAEAGRHLAILGSFAAVMSNPDPERHEYAVAAADLQIVETEGVAVERVTLEARCTAFDRATARATAEGALYAPDGRLLATLRVDYHVLPVRALRAMFPERTRPIGGTTADPYAAWSPAPVLTAEGDRVTTGLDRVAEEACAGHFPGLPAFPVSILGREVFAAVAEAMSRQGATDLRVRRAKLETERFVWAGSDVRFEATADGACTVVTEGEIAARFVLDCVARAGRLAA